MLWRVNKRIINNLHTIAQFSTMLIKVSVQSVSKKLIEFEYQSSDNNLFWPKAMFSKDIEKIAEPGTKILGSITGFLNNLPKGITFEIKLNEA